eukprot:6298247-Amphidinium_carterae.1
MQKHDQGSRGTTIAIVANYIIQKFPSLRKEKSGIGKPWNHPGKKNYKNTKEIKQMFIPGFCPS